MFIKKFAGAALVAVILVGNAFSQEDANIPFVVNADATVSAARGSDTVRITVENGIEKIMTIPAGILVSVRHSTANRQINTANLRVDSRGNLNLNLPHSDYQSATFSLYSINGRRVMNTNVNETTRNFTRSNVAPGVYIMSVKGINGNSFTSRFNHRGGAMNVNVSYGDISNSGLRREVTAFLTSSEEWNIRVRATGYVDTVYTLAIVGGNNPRQTITLRSSSDNGGGEPTCTAGQNCPDDIGTCTNSSGTCTNDIQRSNCTGTFVVGERCTFAVTVSAGTGATGGGNYEPGATVIISVGTMSTGQHFRYWNVRLDRQASTNFVNLANPYNVTTTFTMPAHSVIATVWFDSLSVDCGEYDPTTHFCDMRDGRIYRMVNMPDGKTWMAENLNFSVTRSWCGRSNCNAYGRIYEWHIAMDFFSNSTPSCIANSCSEYIQSPHRGVCPVGWHLPSADEWRVLLDAVGGAGTAGPKLRSQTGWSGSFIPGTEIFYGTDEFGFSALPGGGMWNESFLSNDNERSGLWWAATEDVDYGARSAWYIDMRLNAEYVNVSTYNKNNMHSVRCVKDD